MNDNHNINNLNQDPEKEFKVPEGYFESFNSRLMDRIHREDELKEFSVLSSIQKQNCFIVPVNYFETRNFAASALRAPEQKEAVVIGLASFVRKRGLSIAAMLILVLGVATFMKVYNSSSAETKAGECIELACLTKEDIANSKYFEQISLDEIETVASSAMLDSIGSKMNEEVLKGITIDPDAIHITDEDLGI